MEAPGERGDAGLPLRRAREQAVITNLLRAARPATGRRERGRARLRKDNLAGYLFISGRSNSTVGQYKDNDEVFFWIRYLI